MKARTLRKIKTLGGFFARLEDLKTRTTSVEERIAKFNKIAERGIESKWSLTAIEALEYQQLVKDRDEVVADNDALQADWKAFNEAPENNDS